MAKEYLVILVVGLCILGVKGQLQSCPKCADMSYSISGLSWYYKYTIDSTLQKLSVGDPGCLLSSAPTQTCPVPKSGSVNKCQTAVVAINATGLNINYMLNFPDSKITVTMTVRNCVAVQAGEADGCTDLGDLDEEIQNGLQTILAGMADLWDSATFSGQVCKTTS